jgi:cytochrome P450
VESLYEEKEKNKSEGKTDEFEYTTEDLIDEFCTFLVAGTDTTSHLLMMMVYYVCDNPRIEERLRREINEVIKTDDDYTFENLKKLEYIDWI